MPPQGDDPLPGAVQPDGGELVFSEEELNFIRRILLNPAITRIEQLNETMGETNELLVDQGSRISGMQGQLDAMISGLETVAGDVFDTRAIFPWNLSVDVPADTSRDDPVIEEREMPHDATIMGFLTVSVPAAQSWVGAKIKETGGPTWAPRDPLADAEFMPLDENPIESTLAERLEEGQKFRVEYINNDTAESHFAKTIIYIREGW